jgi:hypothetical protein
MTGWAGFLPASRGLCGDYLCETRCMADYYLARVPGKSQHECRSSRGLLVQAAHRSGDDTALACGNAEIDIRETITKPDDDMHSVIWNIDIEMSGGSALQFPIPTRRGLRDTSRACDEYGRRNTLVG